MRGDCTQYAWTAAIPSDLKLVLLALCKIAGDQAEFHVEISEAVRLTGMPGRRIRPCIIRLEQLGQLSRTHVAPKTIYRLHPY